MTRFVEVQVLLGRRVRDAAGEIAGRIESIRAERIGPRCVVQEYQLGTAAFLDRAGIVVSRLFGFGGRSKMLRVPWQQLDLTNPREPLIRCSVDELRAMQPQLPPADGDGPPPRDVTRD